MHGYKTLHVGDLTENVKFLEQKLVMHYAMHGDKKFVCDDFNEHDNLIERELVMHVYTILYGAILTKMTILNLEN